MHERNGSVVTCACKGLAVGRTAQQPEASEGAPQKYIIFVCTKYITFRIEHSVNQGVNLLRHHSAQPIYKAKQTGIFLPHESNFPYQP